jgi:CubicO group peptidase (beta-lactamase class C family)
VLERAAGAPYDRLLQEEILNPLQLKNIAVEGMQSDESRLATGYSSERPRLPETHSLEDRMVASGGLMASAPDLARFLSAQIEPGSLSREALAQLHSPVRLLDGAAAQTGLGWEVRQRKSIGRVLKKSGGRSNCDAWIGFAPDHGVGVAVVTNCGGPEVDPIGYWLLERSVAGIDPGLLDRTPAVELEFAKVAPFTGVRWENDRTLVLVGGRWQRLVSVDGIPVDRIMEFAQQEFGVKGRKRFAEDLVELLSIMEHEPGWDVTLVLEQEDGTVETLEETMTFSKREQVYESQ